MKIRELVYGLLTDWKMKLQGDEWYFTKGESKYLEKCSSAEAFTAIPDLIDIILELAPVDSEEDKFIYTELLAFLSSVVLKSRTTEMPPRFIEKFSEVSSQAVALGESQRAIVREIKNWYRMESDEVSKWATGD